MVWLFLLLIPVFIAGSVMENCMSWAIRQRLLKGGALIIRSSRFADELLTEDKRDGFLYWLARRIPHFLWKDESGDVWQYTVTEEWRDRWRGKGLLAPWFALWFYDGQVLGEE